MRRGIVSLFFVIGLSALLLAGSESARAATLTVTNLGDDGSPGQLRTLMNAAASGDTIVIPAGTIILSGQPNEDANAGGDLDVLKNLIIQGAGAGTTIIDGGGADGVFDILAPRTLTLSGVTIRNGINSAQAGGGGIRNFGTLNLSNATVSNNQAAQTTAGIRNNGGGIRNLATMSLTNVLITANLARGSGGGIYNEQGSVMTLADVTVSGNTVEIDGGGIYNLGTATLTKVTVSGNNADTAGGGIFTGGAVVSSATATLTNVTVSGNHVNTSGGGIYNSATAILTNVTLTGNSAGFSGGGIANFGSTTLKNVIVAGNSGVLVPGTGNCSGTITSLGHNVDSVAGCGFAGPGDLRNTDPLLGPLQDNGGFTFTHELLSGSPAIDAGTNTGCPASDQRGFPRVAACDIGAYEFAAAADIVAPIVSLSSPTSGSAVSGAVAASADATDNVAVIGVQFKLDGVALGLEVTSPPYSLSWDTTRAGNGPHNLSASARDAAGNVGASASVAITVNNTTDFNLSLASTSSSSAAIPAGATANYTLNVAPTAGFTGSMAFTCTGAPQASTCTVTPNPAPVSGHDVTAVTVSIRTTARTLTGNRRGLKPFEFAFLWAAVLLPGLVLVKPAMPARRKLRNCIMIVACLAPLFLISCGGGKALSSPPAAASPTGTPAGRFTITVTGTAGAVTHSMDLSLTVN